MKQFNTVLGQMLAQVPRQRFQTLVQTHGGDRYVKRFTCWSQMVCMLYAQLAGRRSLRDLERSLAAQARHSRHLNLAACKRNTLANANRNRDWRLYRDLFLLLRERCQAIAPRRGFRFKNKLFSLDSTVIDLCLSLYAWANFRSTKAGVKVHTVLDHDGLVPHFAVVTPANVSDIEAARGMTFERGSILVVDRGYVDYAWLNGLTEGGVFFVTRLKRGARYGIESFSRKKARWPVLVDRTVRLKGASAKRCPAALRLVAVYDETKGETYEFLTNIFHLSASTIAALYKARWRIELFFKEIKQNLRIKRFLGTSENAVQTQIWTALIACLLAAFLKFQSRCRLSVGEVLRLLQTTLFERKSVFDLLHFLDGPPGAMPNPNSQLEFSLL